MEGPWKCKWQLLAQRQVWLQYMDIQPGSVVAEFTWLYSSIAVRKTTQGFPVNRGGCKFTTQSTCFMHACMHACMCVQSGQLPSPPSIYLIYPSCSKGTPRQLHVMIHNATWAALKHHSVHMALHKIHHAKSGTARSELLLH
jgi:hypothetical protein